MSDAGAENVGGPGTLSAREEQVLRLRATGMTSKRIAYVLGTSEQTVKNQCTTVYEKLGVTDLVSAMHAMGWVNLRS